MNIFESFMIILIIVFVLYFSAKLVENARYNHLMRKIRRQDDKMANELKRLIDDDYGILEIHELLDDIDQLLSSPKLSEKEKDRLLISKNNIESILIHRIALKDIIGENPTTESLRRASEYCCNIMAKKDRNSINRKQ